ncbi:MAG: hypothetical protein Q8R31_04950 [Candidatus Omnitrophota bacterium]|nr:hypothetical protein [Candidatus Omnitrophota bacterium]
MDKIFSKILITVIVCIIIGGALVCQLGWAQKDETAKCSPIDFPNYEIAKDDWGGRKGAALELQVDLNGDKEEETIRVYREPKEECERIKPIMVKIFSGTDDCPKEVFTYYGMGNETGKVETFWNFWGDRSNVVLVEDISYACGSGSSVRLRFFVYRNGKYLVAEGPLLGGFWKYKLDGGDSGLGKRIIAAYNVFEEGDCGTCAQKMQLEIYNWDGKKYVKRKAGLTQGKYFSESINEIIQKEPFVLNLK